MTTRLNNILDRLPSLYRPDADVTGLLLTFLAGVAESLEEVNQDTIEVLRSHWFNYTDRALLSPYVTLGRERQSLAPPRIGDLIDFVDPGHFIGRLRDVPDPLSQHLRDRLPSEIAELVRVYRDAQPPQEGLQRGVIETLNQVVRDGPLYDLARFDQVTLSQETPVNNVTPPINTVSNNSVAPM